MVVYETYDIYIYICMYVCMYACMHACMYVYIYIYVYMYIYNINVRILHHPQYIGHIYIYILYDFYGICDSLWRLKQTGMHTLQFLSIFDG